MSLAQPAAQPASQPASQPDGVSDGRSDSRFDHDTAAARVCGSSAAGAELVPCPRGPLLVRGATSVEDGDGRSHPVTRPVVAVCACGTSQRQPWCDGTHKVIPAG